jgi:hypothetical protein
VNLDIAVTNTTDVTLDREPSGIYLLIIASRDARVVIRGTAADIRRIYDVVGAARSQVPHGKVRIAR